MVRRKQQRPPFGMPKGVVLLATPEGWRHSVHTADGGTVCGRLADVPAGADPAEARAATATLVARLARDVHAVDVDVTWEPPRGPGSWSARVTVAAPSEHAG
ncbi:MULTISPECIES: hypothetical protein [unclassified Streptomyces]|uniref:hypothetical protein n=1 Tax=unclassified Streptomyces TaxID=2593676 RepID=UPI00115FC1A0|nr:MULTISPECIES: hypothetical protein [unclassified Streptomyces]